MEQYERAWKTLLRGRSHTSEYIYVKSSNRQNYFMVRNRNNGCLEGGADWLGKAGGIVQGRWKWSLSWQQCELQGGVHLPKCNDPHKSDLFTCMYIIPQEKFFMLECFMYFCKREYQKTFPLFPNSRVLAISPFTCRVETSGILWRVMCGSTSRFTTGSDSLHKCHQNQKGILLLNQQPTPPSLPFLSAF